MLAERKQQPVFCVTRNFRISLPECSELSIFRTESLPETILTTVPYWTETNVFLLGDVFYSEHAISLMLDCQRALSFFGRPWPSSYVRCGHGEMFGLACSNYGNGLARDLMIRGLSVRESGKEANLWNLYQLAGGLPFGSSRYLPGLLGAIDDYTNDIDEPTDYMRRGSLYERISSIALRQANLCLSPNRERDNRIQCRTLLRAHSEPLTHEPSAQQSGNDHRSLVGYRTRAGG